VAKAGSQSAVVGHSALEVDDWLWQTVATKGIPIGRVVDVILDAESENVVGLEVRCQDGRHRFLPRAAAKLVGSEIEIDSPLALLDTDQLDFYRRRGVSLRAGEEPAA
jgi:PRC-barrel domain protein